MKWEPSTKVRQEFRNWENGGEDYYLTKAKQSAEFEQTRGILIPRFTCATTQQIVREMDIIFNFVNFEDWVSSGGKIKFEFTPRSLDLSVNWR